MAYGYSVRFADLIKKQHRANPCDPIYILGKLLVDNNIMVSEITDTLDVSKQAVYKWFAGEYTPRPEQIIKINNLIKKLRKQYV